MNVLLFVTDEQRLEGVGAYGRSPVKTPCLDRLVQASTLFENSYTSCPVCTPARASILTGLYPHAHGMTANIHEMGCAIHEIPDSERLLSRRLQSIGYSCGYTGKWHLGTDWPFIHNLEPWWKIAADHALPSNRGFLGQDFPGHGGGGQEYPGYQAWLKDKGASHQVRPHKFDGEKITGYGILEGTADTTVSCFLADHTISLIDKFAAENRPFFIWHNDWGPHGAHLVPQDYYDLYRDIDIPEWPNFRWAPPQGHPSIIKAVPQASAFSWMDWADVLRHYYGFCTLIDEQFGRIVNHLEKAGVAEETLIVFCSDHGETLGSHGGLTDKGFSHFEEIQRIPLIVYDPRTRQKRICESFASLLDIYPTICDYAGVTYDRQSVHGRSLRPLVEGRECIWRDTIFVEFFGLGHIGNTMITCRHEHWKYGWTAAGLDELYNLEEDPAETVNLIEEPNAQAVVSEMRRRMYVFMKESGYRGSGVFLRSKLGWNVDHQFLSGQAPCSIDEELPNIFW